MICMVCAQPVSARCASHQPNRFAGRGATTSVRVLHIPVYSGESCLGGVVDADDAAGIPANIILSVN